MTKKRIISVAVILLLIIGIVGWVVYEIKSGTVASDITAEEAQKSVNTQFDKIAIGIPVQYIAENNEITVNSVSYGDEKNVILDCTVKTVDAHGAISPEYDRFLSSSAKKGNGTMFKSTLDYQMEFEQEMVKLLKEAKTTECKIQLMMYETSEGFKIYTDEAAINAVFGGIQDIEKEVKDKKIVKIKNPDGSVEEKKIQSTNVNKGFIECLSIRSSMDKPETATGIVKVWKELKKDFEINFIRHDRWQTILKGLWVTIKLTICALIIGIFLGFIVAFVRCTYLKTSKPGVILRIFNGICQLYLTVIRGTPAVVQIMIIYFVIFMPLGVDKFLAAVICFGLNSGAYVAEIVRGGIMNIDDGQVEAGRSLGFNYMQTMGYVVLPQAFKAVLPALANEFVVLLKETSVAFYIGLGDLMYSGNAIRSATYSAFMPLVAVALIYLVMVLGLSKLVSMLERRLRSNER